MLCKIASNSLSQNTLSIPETRFASSLVYLCPSQTAMCSLVCLKKSTSLYSGLGQSGNNIKILCSWSIPVRKKKSGFCLNKKFWSPFLGNSSFEWKIAKEDGFSRETKFFLLMVNNSLRIGR